MPYIALIITLLALLIPITGHARDKLWLKPPKPEVTLLGKPSIKAFHSGKGTKCTVRPTSKKTISTLLEDAHWYISDGFCVTRGQDLKQKYEDLRRWLLTPKNYPATNGGIKQLLEYERVDQQDQNYAGLEEHEVFIRLKGFGIDSIPLFSTNYIYTVRNRPTEEKKGKITQLAVPWDTQVPNAAFIEGDTPLKRVQGLWFVRLDESQNPYLYYRYYNAADFGLDIRMGFMLVQKLAKNIHESTLIRLAEVVRD